MRCSKHRFSGGTMCFIRIPGLLCVGVGAWHSYGLRGGVFLPRCRGTGWKHLSMHAAHQSALVRSHGVCAYMRCFFCIRALLCAPAAKRDEHAFKISVTCHEALLTCPHCPSLCGWRERWPKYISHETVKVYFHPFNDLLMIQCSCLLHIWPYEGYFEVLV